MRYELRLAELLRHTPDSKRRPGIIKAIVEYTGLDRHQVASLLKNDIKYLPLESLSRLCDYLVEHGHATADQLPGALFAVKPEHFWELIARRRKLEICAGVRRSADTNSAEAAWVVASDAVLMGAVLNGVSTLGGTDKLLRRQSSEQSSVHPELLKQTLVWSPSPLDSEFAIDHARAVHLEFNSEKGDNALICLGSVKSNPVSELVITKYFKAEAFKSEDHVRTADERSIPFFLRYRDTDPHPASASAGVRLSKKQEAEQAGIYFENASGKWEYAGGHDTALVFYAYNESTGRLEMVLSGFSGRATRMLARTLSNRADEFWPPIFQESNLQVGAYIVKYEFDDAEAEAHDLLRTNLSANPTITAIPIESITRRLRSKARRETIAS